MPHDNSRIVLTALTLPHPVDKNNEVRPPRWQPNTLGVFKLRLRRKWMLMCLLEPSVLSMRPPAPFRCCSVVLFHFLLILVCCFMFTMTYLQKQVEYSYHSAHKSRFLWTAVFIRCLERIVTIHNMNIIIVNTYEITCFYLLTLWVVWKTLPWLQCKSSDDVTHSLLPKSVLAHGGSPLVPSLAS